MFIQSIPGGKGIGMMYMVMYIIITVFIVGLMSGRTPEYLGIKITGHDVKLVMIAFLIHPLIILIPTLLSYATGAAAAIGVVATLLDTALHKFSGNSPQPPPTTAQTSLGASANTPFFNIATGIVMLIGRYAPIAILLALSGSMIGRKRGGTSGLKTDSLVFTIVLVVAIIILVVLTFFPFLALGPISSFFGGLINGF